MAGRESDVSALRERRRHGSRSAITTAKRGLGLPGRWRQQPRTISAAIGGALDGPGCSDGETVNATRPCQTASRSPLRSAAGRTKASTCRTFAALGFTKSFFDSPPGLRGPETPASVRSRACCPTANHHQPAAAGFAGTPEPGTWAMMLIGLRRQSARWMRPVAFRSPRRPDHQTDQRLRAVDWEQGLRRRPEPFSVGRAAAPARQGLQAARRRRASRATDQEGVLGFRLVGPWRRALASPSGREGRFGAARRRRFDLPGEGASHLVAIFHPGGAGVPGFPPWRPRLAHRRRPSLDRVSALVIERR